MESVDMKACKIQTRKVAQDVLMFVWYRNTIISEKPTPELSFVPEITAEFLDNLCVSVLVESSCNEYVWEDFLKNHFERLTTTPYLFANYFAYASYILIEKATDAHACFIDILSLVTHFALHCWQKEDKKFLNSCVDLFCVFFDEEICQKFEGQGRWKNFNEYLKNQGNLKKYKEFIDANKLPIEFFKEFQSKLQESNKPYAINDVVLKDVTLYQVENHKKAVSFADLVGDKMKKVCSKKFEEILKDFPKVDNQVEELYRETVGEASGGMTSVKEQFSEEVQDILENVPSKDNLKIGKDQSQVKEHETFKKVPKDFPRIDSQTELQRETVIVASGGRALSEDQSSSQELQKETFENISSNTCSEKKEDIMKKGKASDLLKTQDSEYLKSRDLSSAFKESDPTSKVAKVERIKALLEEMVKDIAKVSELIKFLCEEDAIKLLL